MLKIKDPLQFFIAFILTIIAVFGVANYLQSSQYYSVLANSNSLLAQLGAGLNPTFTLPYVTKVIPVTPTSKLFGYTVTETYDSSSPRKLYSRILEFQPGGLFRLITYLYRPDGTTISTIWIYFPQTDTQGEYIQTSTQGYDSDGRSIGDPIIDRQYISGSKSNLTPTPTPTPSPIK